MNKNNNLEQELDRLGEQITSQPSIVDAVMQRVEAMPAAPVRPAPRLGRIIVKATMAMAASILVGIAVWLGVVGGPTAKVYGIQESQQRLQTVKSYHLKGWRYYELEDRDGNRRLEKVPTEVYVGWPCQRYATSFGNFNGVLGTSYVAENGERYIEVDHLDRTCSTGRNYPFATQLYVAAFLEQTPRTLMLGDPSSYQKLRREKIDGVLADVYESTSSTSREDRSRSVVWLNPSTGVPVRMASYQQKEAQPERLVVEHYLVEVDTPPPPELFTFEPPAGYKVIHKDRGPDSVHNGTGGRVNSVEHKFRFEFNINDRAILVCWAWYDTSKTPYFEPDPSNPPGQMDDEMTLASSTNDRKYRLVPLRDDPADKFHWHWSLIVPEDGKPIGKDQPRLTLSNKRGTSAHVSSAWRRLSHDTLADFVLKAQRLTLPEGSPADAALTLEQIEAKIAELQQAP